MKQRFQDHANDSEAKERQEKNYATKTQPSFSLSPQHFLFLKDLRSISLLRLKNGPGVNKCYSARFL